MMVARAATKRASRKRHRSRSGSTVRRCWTTNAAMAVAAKPAAAIPGTDVQPSEGASMIAQTKAIRPAPERTAPVQSMRTARGPRASGMTRRPTRIATAQSGTLTMKIDPHQNRSSRTPPRTGPIATPRPAVAAQMPMAVARSRGSAKTLSTMDSVAGMMNAAPAPISARSAISSPTPPAKAAAAEAKPEHRQRREQRPAPSEAIAEGAGQEQQTGEREGVGADHPLKVADAGVQVADEGGQRDVDDRVVDHDGEQARAQDAQHRPAPARAGHDVTAAALGADVDARRARTR